MAEGAWLYNIIEKNKSLSGKDIQISYQPKPTGK